MNDHENVKALKRNILMAAHKAKEGHIASAFSVLDLIYMLYGYVLDVCPECPTRHDRDRFILSKGHASLALYAVLEEAEYLRPGELSTFCQPGSRLGGHPCDLVVPGVEASTGSLGHGLPIAVGMAMAMQNDRSENRVYCIIGDGEMNEGSVWESLLLAGHHKLSNLTVILDHNRSNDRALKLPDIPPIAELMHWAVTTIDGHNHDDIMDAMSFTGELQPRFVVAHTIKGKGIKDMEDNPHAWHHRAPNDQELTAFLEELR